jgi:hypothetical protein
MAACAAAGTTRFGTVYLMLERLLRVKQCLQQMMMDENYDAWVAKLDADKRSAAR